jgi:hypothetical protein
MTSIAGFLYPGTWTGSTANMPSVTPTSNDSLLTNGSLVLIDPSDSNYQWPSGVPASGVYLPNLAWDRASNLVTLDANDLGCPYSNTLTGANESISERSAKGGLHTIVSQVNSSVSSHRATIRPATAIEAYISANPNHSYYFSLWESVDRLSTASQWPVSGIFKSSAQTSAYNFYLQASSSGVAMGNGSGARLGFRSGGNGYGTLGPVFTDGAVSAWAGTLPASDAVVYLAAWGNLDAFAPFTENKAASKIFYRCYLEDLTVSARSYTTVDALDYALWTAAFSTNGKFYGDTTPTAVSALP